MDGSSGILPVMPIGDGGGMGGNSFFWLFGLLILLGMLSGNGLGLGGNGNLENSMQRGFDNQNLQSQTRDILGAVTSGTAQTIAASTANATNAINAIKDGNASLIREFGNVETALTALGGKQQECCCNILRATDEVKYNDAINTAAINAGIADAKYASALNTAAINATTVEQTQRILDAIAQNKVEALQAQVNELQMQNAMNGVVRYPSAWTYNAGMSPFCGCNGCGC